MRLSVPDTEISDEILESDCNEVVPVPSIFLERSPERRREPLLVMDPERFARVEERIPDPSIETLLAIEEELETLPAI